MKHLFVLSLLLLLALPAYAQHTVTLNWNPSSDGSGNPTLGYDIYRGTAAGAEGTTPINSTVIDIDCLLFSTCTYVDSTVVTGQTYYYYAKSVLNGKFSPASNEAPATIPLAAPTNLTTLAQ